MFRDVLSHCCECERRRPLLPKLSFLFFLFTQKDVGDLSSLKSKLVGPEKDIVEIKNTVELQGNKIEYQENQSRRNNIRVFGIPESAGETWEMAETKVRAAIKEKLNIEVDIEHAHRVERRKSGGIN